MYQQQPVSQSVLAAASIAESVPTAASIAVSRRECTGCSQAECTGDRGLAKGAGRQRAGGRLVLRSRLQVHVLPVVLDFIAKFANKMDTFCRQL